MFSPFYICLYSEGSKNESLSFVLQRCGASNNKTGRIKNTVLFFIRTSFKLLLTLVLRRVVVRNEIDK